MSNALHRVVYLSAQDDNGNGRGNFKFTVTDNAQSPLTSIPATVTVNITPTADAPVA